MKAALCNRFGDPEVVEIGTLPEPRAGDGEVVVDVKSVALNFFDTLMIRNKYQFKPEFPFSPGAEIAGQISSVGAGVKDLVVGQRVMAFPGINGCREKISINAELAVPLPNALSDDIAACINVTYGTAIHALKDRGRLQSGETVVVLGASGGAGLAAIQIAKLMGARVIAAASSPQKLEVCRSRGADEIIDYTNEDLKARIKELTDSKGADMIYDCVGGSYTEPALRSTAWGGRFLVIGFAAGEIPKIPMNLPLLKCCDIVGVFWGAFTRRDPLANAKNIGRIVNWCADGTLVPYIEKTFPLEETRKALELIDQRRVRGKIIVRP